MPVDESEFEALKQAVAELRARIDRMTINTNRVLETGNWFAGSGGTYGTSNKTARSDHTH